MNIKKSTQLYFYKTTAVCVYIYCLFFITNKYFDSYSALNPLSWPINTYLFEPIALMMTFLMILILTCRLKASLINITCLYIFFMLINSEMVEVLGLIFSPIDIKHSIQVFFAKEFLFSYWKSLICVLVLITLMIVMVFKAKPNNYLKKIRIPVLVLLIPAFLLISMNRFAISEQLIKNFNLRGQSIPQTFAEYHGFLFSFYYQILKKRPVENPVNYSQDSIEKLKKKYSSKLPHETPKIKPHVIIFFIEAFADPKQMGIVTSRDPIPNYRKYAKEGVSGLVMSPELGGRSANPEFELLTGLSMRFVPDKSIPYIDYINKPYPSLAREFESNGYVTHALHVASLSFFNYKKAYHYLGFDHVDTLYQRDGVELDPINRFPSENALVEEIFKITDTSKTPQFIFSFPNSTHGLWDYDAYIDSDLNVSGDYIGDGKQHLKTYVNAINKADQSIGKLIAHYEKNDIPAVVMVLGDHQPALPEFRQAASIKLLSKLYPELEFTNRKKLKRAIKHKILKTDVDYYNLNHQVPYLIWSNVISNKIKIENTSMNFLSARLLQDMKMQRSSFYHLLATIYEKLKEFSIMTRLPSENVDIIDEYKLLQFDIMSGKNYYMGSDEM